MNRHAMPRTVAATAKVGVVLVAGASCGLLSAQYYLDSQDSDLASTKVSDTSSSTRAGADLPEASAPEGPITVYRAPGSEQAPQPINPAPDTVKAPSRQQQPQSSSKSS